MNLNKCCKEHNFPNILLEEFNDTQKINELTILCHECKKNKAIHNLFYKCCNCNFNLCPACKEKHNKDHIILNYELKNYLCNTHGEKYVSYCKKCNQNLCNSCLSNHKDHTLINFKEVLKNKSGIRILHDLRAKIDFLKNEIKEMINKFNKVFGNLEIFYNISNNIIKN